MSDLFGDRMKEYEAAETGRRFMPLLPMYARIDGRCFSNFTHGMARPYDERMSLAMVETTKHLVGATHARIGYTQSDEISLTWMQDRYDSDLLFGGKVYKLCSVLASMTAAKFGAICREIMPEFADRLPAFDCRVFQLPNRTEGANAFLWREQDAAKNAVSMAARSVYSAKQLHGRSGPEMQEMLFQKGINFNDYPPFFKRGTFVRRIVVRRRLSEEERARIPEAHRPTPDAEVERSEIVEITMPVFSKVTNREAVVFEAADPIVANE